MSPKILIVEDDVALRDQLGESLSYTFGYEIVTAGDTPTAMQVFKSEKPDLILLDLMLPGKDPAELTDEELRNSEPAGVIFCRDVRKVSGVPIIMLTAKTEDEDLTKGLEAGADDYLKKPPPSVAEIDARIKARLRSFPVTNQEIVTIGPIVMDIAGHEVRRDGKRLSLTPLEFNLLRTLAENPKTVFSREMLLETVWGYQYKADTRLVNVHVQRLRSKIEDDPEDPKIVTTVRGVGYKAGSN